MADYPAIPLWTDALLADTPHLSDAEFGLYLRLLILTWRSPRCRIPNDLEWIRAKFPDDERNPQRAQMVAKLLNEFYKGDGNYLRQKRLTRERLVVAKMSQKQSVRAKQRWNKEKARSPGNAAAMPPHPHPHMESVSTISPRSRARAKKVLKNGHDDGGARSARGGGAIARGAGARPRRDFSDPVERYTYACTEIVKALTKTGKVGRGDAWLILDEAARQAGAKRTQVLALARKLHLTWDYTKHAEATDAMRPR
jgi:uncharacterized protein YdaU (DUF1376 family)